MQPANAYAASGQRRNRTPGVFDDWPRSDRNAGKIEYALSQVKGASGIKLLEGITVLDFRQFLSGPSAAMRLGIWEPESSKSSAPA